MEGFSKEDVQKFVSKIGNDRDQQWFWEAIRAIRHVFPKIDFWVTGGSDKTYIDVRAGRKETEERGNPVMYFRYASSDNPVELHFYEKIRDNFPESPLTPEKFPTFDSITGYLIKNRASFGAVEANLQGNAFNPDLYSATQTISLPASVHSTLSQARLNQPLNQILYGPPGTGKTYHSIYAALEILDPEAAKKYQSVIDDPASSSDDRNKSRAVLKARFDELVDQERVRFVTFHQSFSYEDFVEGLRAENDENKQLNYVVQDGIFKQIVRDASRVEISTQSINNVSENARIWKISIGGAGESRLKTHCLQKGEARIGWAALGDMRTIDEDGKAYLTSLGSNNQSTVLSFANEIAVGDVIVSIDGQDKIGAVGVVTRDYYYDPSGGGDNEEFPHAIKVDWLYKNLNLSPKSLNAGKSFTLKTVYPLDRFKWPLLLDAIIKSGAQAEGTTKISDNASNLPFVLIIDEINRGNISRIFGELITLIEPSKRAGADEALSVTLPYSKEAFSVPENVYLIGTMNTADRSLAGLDLALRRRFSFTEMPPRPDLLKNIEVAGTNIGDMLEVMNQRITALLDKDHCIGHAYFMGLSNGSNISDLAEIFAQKIIPLLQEYFFEDWERVRWVLNDQSKEEKHAFIIDDKSISVANLFPKVNDKLRASPRWKINRDAFFQPESYTKIVSVKDAPEAVAEATVMDSAK